jgi:hypothetical protein
MHSPSVPKIGLELSSDLRKLARSYPGCAAFQHAAKVLDLQSVWLEVRDTVDASRRGRLGNRMGLSSLSELFLGKPMDKAMQVRA